MSTYSVKYQPKSVVEVTMNISNNDITQAYTRALKKASAKAALPGFRKGKAPEAMVESYLGKEKIYEEALNTAIPDEFEKALKEDHKESKERIIVLNYPDFKLTKEWKPGDDLTVVATCTIYPRFNIDKLEKELKVKKGEATATTEQEVEESVNKIFEQYKKIKQEEKTKNGEQEATKIIVPGQEEKSEQKEIALDDNFAKAAGAPSLEELRKMIKSEIEYDKQMKSEREFEEAVIKKAQELVDIDIPDILIEEELNRIEQRFTSQLSRIGTTLEKYLETENKTKEEVRKEWYERAYENTKLALILQELRVKRDLKVSDEEVKALAVQNGITKGLTEEQYNTLAYIIGQSKALEVIKELALDK